MYKGELPRNYGIPVYQARVAMYIRSNRVLGPMQHQGAFIIFVR
jgi:hypothetical protein